MPKLPENCIRIWKTSSGYSTEMGYPTTLIYNTAEKILYYYIEGIGGNSMCPYLGHTGMPCRLKDGKIVEISEID